MLHLCISVFKGIGSHRSCLSLYVRIIAYQGGKCVVLPETEEDSDRAWRFSIESVPVGFTELVLSGSAESARASKLLEDRLRGPEPLVEIVIVQSDSLTVDDTEFQVKVESVFHEIMALGGETVVFGRNYYPKNDVALVSADRQTTIMEVMLAGNFDEAAVNVEHVIDVVKEADAADEFRVLVGGTASIPFETNELSQHDL